MHKSGTGYAYTKHTAALPDHRKVQQMGYGETVVAVCAGTVVFVLFGVAAAYAAAWILDNIGHK